MPRKREIEAAIAAHNEADQETLLPPDAARLLTVMFPRSSECQRRLNDLAAEGFDRTALARLLRALIEAGFLSKEEQTQKRSPSTYHLHLPPWRQR